MHLSCKDTQPLSVTVLFPRIRILFHSPRYNQFNNPAATDRKFLLSILSYLQALCHMISSWTLQCQQQGAPDTSKVADQAVQSCMNKAWRISWSCQRCWEDFNRAVQHHLYQDKGITPS